MEASLDGTGAHVIASGQKSPEAVAVDASHLYWTNFGAGTIMEASLDGTGAKAIASGQGRAVGVAVGRSEQRTSRNRTAVLTRHLTGPAAQPGAQPATPLPGIGPSLAFLRRVPTPLPPARPHPFAPNAMTIARHNAPHHSDQGVNMGRLVYPDAVSRSSRSAQR